MKPHITRFLQLLLFLFSFMGSAQKTVTVYSEQTAEGIFVYADNPEYCPMTVVVNFELKNIKIDTQEQATFLIKENSKRVLLTNVNIIDKYKPSKFGFTYFSNYGDDKQTSYDTEYAYFLPFEKGNTFGLHQGYNGSFSHQNEYSLDFTMPVGTPITAIRDGVVVKIVQNNVLVCPKKECAKYNNYLIIYHSDGTFVEYTHLKKNAVKVKVGDAITQGQVIAESGNTGWSSGPHLHLVVYLQKLKNRESIPTKFKINDGTTIDILKEKEKYSRNY